jgi:uncharacterized protein involved in response to NO
LNNHIGGIPRYRSTALPAVFSQGFRPLFLAAALWAPIALTIWLLELSGFLTLPTAFAGATWHAHEMIFGFASAATAGYLMTAIPNWTGRMPLQGLPLAILLLIWLMGRIAVLVSASIGGIAAAVADLAFPTLLLLAVAREVVAGRNWRNLPIIAALSFMLAANAATHLAAAGLIDDVAIGYRGGVAVFAGLLALVGGRVIPSFTRNRLARIGASRYPAPFGLIDRLALFAVLVALISWVIALPPPLDGSLLLFAGVMTALRLARWNGWRTLGDPSLWILHVGYGWLAGGLALLGASALVATVPAAAGLHALTAGAIGSSILGVMGRTTLAQTGRRATFAPGSHAVHGLITIAAALRVMAAWSSENYGLLLTGSATAWILAFGVFLALYGRPLITPRSSKHATSASADADSD